MRLRYFLLIVTGFYSVACEAQIINICTNPAAQQVMMGAYDPAAYTASIVLNQPDTISQGINAQVSPDSLHAYLLALKSFYNRNTGSDTLSATGGIGAARRWAFSKFRQFSSRNENRLLPSYLQFDTTICGIAQHRNILAVLPGMDTGDKSIVVIEGHIDSRCTNVCDTACVAQGMEDNGSGTALVLELARVMSRYSYNHTIVFLITIGEEQGLFGGWAFANFIKANGIKVKGVMNNDITGGIICGHTSSAPGCPGYDNIDSTHVRLFSYGGFSSFHKGLARFIKLEYKEMIVPYAAVPMTINVMTAEDRTGRGGDHIPFRTLGYTAIRVTSQNEAGDANVTSGSYIDRQHTSSDSLGVDVNGDGLTDTFFVDFNYLSRNTVINGNAAGMMAVGPQTPDFAVATAPGRLIINVTQHPEYLNYRVGVRTTTYDWDSVYTFTGSVTDTIIVPAGNYIVSIASVDGNGVESLFSRELTAAVLPDNGVTNVASAGGIELLQNKPNPVDEATMISVLVNKPVVYKEACISIRDMNGREVQRQNVTLNQGMNEVMYEHGYHVSGTYIYTLLIDGKAVQSRKMVFNN
jgi:hypothetical protein